jgi:hypothetical protein
MVAEASDLRPLLQSQAVQLVEQLRTLPTPLPAAPRSDGRIDPVEERRREVYRQLRELRGDTVAALATALGDADVSMKRNVALALNVLASTWFEPSQPRLDIRACLRRRFEERLPVRAQTYGDLPSAPSTGSKDNRRGLPSDTRLHPTAAGEPQSPDRCAD